MSATRFDVDAFVHTATDEIWNQRLVGKIFDYYAPDVVLRLAGRPVEYGSQQLVIDTTRWLAAFPDAQVFVHEVVSSGGGERYLASERRTFVGRNRGSSLYGAPTGRRAVVETIVNYRIGGGRIVELRVEYDELTLVRDLGVDEQSVLSLRRDVPAPDVAPDDVASGDEETHAEARLVRAALDEVWNGRSVGRLAEYLAEGYRCHGPARRELFGREEYAADVLSLVAALPDLALHVDHQLSAVDGARLRTSTAWTILGTHQGPSPYGAPDDSRVRLTGISNHLVQDGRIVEEWRQFNELDLVRRTAPPDEREREPGGTFDAGDERGQEVEGDG